MPPSCCSGRRTPGCSSWSCSSGRSPTRNCRSGSRARASWCWGPAWSAGRCHHCYGAGSTRRSRSGGTPGPRATIRSWCPRGGQGSDEPVAEAVAMAEYLREQGVPDDRILVEDRATNTEENLRYSRALLDSAGHDEEMLVVTSNYHVMRAAFLARELGLPAQAVGAPTAAYYLPSAFLREFVAVLTRHKLMHAVVGTMILLVSVGAGLVASWL
ncbi:YdcF family protein [Microlunatus sp. Y2014]|uniref:YdcF family protein n=1 Tax=Microlunatus sp. Y2014 TaxID=3418488 RepID=UPI003DA7A610